MRIYRQVICNDPDCTCCGPLSPSALILLSLLYRWGVVAAACGGVVAVACLFGWLVIPGLHQARMNSNAVEDARVANTREHELTLARIKAGCTCKELENVR